MGFASQARVWDSSGPCAPCKAARARLTTIATRLAPPAQAKMFSRAMRSVILHVQPESDWLPMVEDVVRRFCARTGFSSRLSKALAAATLEAYDNLALTARRHGFREHCRLRLSATEEAVTLELAYNGKIPLNPLAVGEYEVPDATRDVQTINAEALWLHLIKRRMDKVFFRVEGSRHVLSMVKYRRQEGRENEAWVMRLTPRLTPGVNLEIRPPEAGKSRRGVLSNPATGVAFRLGPRECLMVERLDGSRSMRSIYLELVEAQGLFAPRLATVLYERLESAGMLQGKAPRHVTWRDRLDRLFKPRIAIPRSELVMGAVYRRLRWMVGPPGAVLLTALGVSGLYPLLTRLDDIPLSVRFETLGQAPVASLVALYGLVMVMTAVHELAHGLVCTHYGGRVRRMGVMFSYFMFFFYCDLTSVHAFPKTSQKILVSLAGPLTTFAFLGSGLWTAAWLADIEPMWSLVCRAFCFVCLLGLSLDANPFLKMDAYHMLTDALGIARLRERSFVLLRDTLFGWLGAQAPTSDASPPSPWERRIFWCYASLGLVITLAFIVLASAHYGRMLWTLSASQVRLSFAGIILFCLVLRLSRQAHAHIQAWRNREYRLH